MRNPPPHRARRRRPDHRHVELAGVARCATVVLLCVALSNSARADDPAAPVPDDAARTGERVAPQIEPPVPAPSVGEVPPTTGRRGEREEPTTTPLTDEERYRRATNLFEYGDCESVVDMLGDYALVGAGGDEERLAETHRMLGICYFQLGRRAEAERELKSLLYLNPDYVLDPFLTPPPVVELFDGLKSSMRQKLDDVRRARERTQKDAQGAKTVVVERVERRAITPWQTVLLPLGFAQAANGELIKAIVFGVLQGTLLVANVGAWALVQGLRPVPAPEAPVLPVAGSVTLGGSEVSLQAILAQVAWVGMMGALSGFVIAYVAGVGDAWWNHEGDTLIDVEERTREPDVDDG